MKGIILATRPARPLSAIAPRGCRHLVPIYDRPAIHLAIEALVRAGFREVVLVAGGDDAGAIVEHVRSGRALGLRDFMVAVAPDHAGDVSAILCAQSAVGGERACILPADVLLGGSLRHHTECFLCRPEGAVILTAPSESPGEAIVVRPDDGRVVAMDMQPARPGFDTVMVGPMFADDTLFARCRRLDPDAEIPDLALSYRNDGLLEAERLDGWWCRLRDAESLARATNLVRDTGANLAMRPAEAIRALRLAA